MASMDVYGYMKRAFEETVGSRTRLPFGDVQRLEERMSGLENKIAELVSEVRRLAQEIRQRP